MPSLAQVVHLGGAASVAVLATGVGHRGWALVDNHEGGGLSGQDGAGGRNRSQFVADTASTTWATSASRRVGTEGKLIDGGLLYD